jgi:Methyltransferase domain
VVQTHTTRDVTENYSLAAGLAALQNAVTTQFSHAHLLTAAEEIQLLTSKKGQRTLSRSKSSSTDTPPSAAHDHVKQRLIHQDRPWLTALGVTDARHQVVPAMSRKWKQINKFVEVFASALDKANLPANHKVSVADFGSGKGYLTFAVHDFLTTTLRRSTDVLGVELRSDMVNLCNAAASKLKLNGLRFEEGDVSRSVPDKLDVMIALHACDTATDHAIHVGVRTGASVILCSPCCHKQLRPQLMSPHPLQPLLQHGVHLGQQAEMLTDGLRAMLLDACGYETQVFEFVALEHTQKNKMILAVKRAVATDSAPVLAQVRELKSFYGVRDQCLETLLRSSGLLASGGSTHPGNLKPI